MLPMTTASKIRQAGASFRPLDLNNLGLLIHNHCTDTIDKPVSPKSHNQSYQIHNNFSFISWFTKYVVVIALKHESLTISQQAQ